ENVCRLDHIESITPLFVQHVTSPDGAGSRVVVDIKAKVVDYMQEKATGKVVQGDQKVGELDTVWTFIWEKDAWKLNLIEAGSQEWTYLFTPNELPAATGASAHRTA